MVPKSEQLGTDYRKAPQLPAYRSRHKTRRGAIRSSTRRLLRHNERNQRSATMNARDRKQLFVDTVLAGMILINWKEPTRPAFVVIDFESTDFELTNEHGREVMRQSEFRQIETQRKKVQPRTPPNNCYYSTTTTRKRLLDRLHNAKATNDSPLRQ